MKIAVLNQKGGIGKTSISTNLSYLLSESNKKTLLIDLDPQAHSTIIFCPEIPKATVKDLLLNDNADISQLIKPAVVKDKASENLFILPASIHLAAAIEQLVNRFHREKILFNHLKKVDFDFIIIDCPPMLGSLTANAIYASDIILIPTTFSKYALDGIADLFASITAVKETESFHFRIIKNMFDPRVKRTNKFIDDQLRPFEKFLTKTIIRKSESINQAQMTNAPVAIFDPSGNGTKDFQELVKEVLEWAKK